MALAALTGCGSGDGSDGGSDAAGGGAGTGSADDAATSLTIVVTLDEGVEPKTYTLTCDPAGGDHPQPEQACDAIAAAGAEVFDPVGADQACTEIFGGPQVATVTGTYGGSDVDATFSRQNGCEIDRWEKLGATVFAVPLQ